MQSQQGTTASLAETVKTLGSEQATQSALDEQAKLAGRIDSLSKDVAVLKQGGNQSQAISRLEQDIPCCAANWKTVRRLPAIPILPNSIPSAPGHPHHQRHAGADCQPARADRRALSSPRSAAARVRGGGLERLLYRSKASDSPSPWSRLSFPR